MHRGLVRDTTRTADPNGPQGNSITWGITPRSNSWEKKKVVRDVQSDGVHPQIRVIHDETLLSWVSCLPMERSELIP